MTPTTTDAQGIIPYTGHDSVMVGNGSGLPISIVGQFTIPQTSLILHKTLIVPDLKKKLLSVSQFTADNNCCFLFYPWDFLIKDLKTK